MLHVSQTSSAPAARSSSKGGKIAPWRVVGVWMAGLLIVYQLFNVVRAVFNPADFAVAFGVPLSTGDGSAYVLVYAARTLFIGLFGLMLLVRRQWQTLVWYAFIATLMPLADAIIVAVNGGSSGVIARHLLIAGVVAATGFLLARWTARQQSPE